MEKTVNAIAALVGGTVHGDGTRMIRGLASLDEAGANDLAFAVPPHIDAARAGAKAGALLLPKGTEGFSCPVIFVEDPKAAFAKLLTSFTPPIEHVVGVSEPTRCDQLWQKCMDVVTVTSARRSSTVNAPKASKSITASAWSVVRPPVVMRPVHNSHAGMQRRWSRIRRIVERSIPTSPAQR